ncbi:STAS domain-containing protein [Priestia koreensis]|uniref:STAS domain-containing protein n=1 Tax=Priestia koreensis TaxID=284581 RepID=UPI003459F580
MESIGTFPKHLSSYTILEGIQETIIIADIHYRIQWMNSKAVEILGPLMKLYGINDIHDVLGQSMDLFHSAPEHQQHMMQELHSTHRARITIKQRYVAETVIHPVYNENGDKQAYLLMLLDVTNQAKQAERNQAIIDELSTPLLKIWHDILALPIVGSLDDVRGKKLAERVLEACVKEGARYFLIDLSSLKELDDHSGYHIHIMAEALRLIGTRCLIVGISPELVQSLVQYDYRWTTFSTVQQCIAYIMKENHMTFTSTKSPSSK